MTKTDALDLLTSLIEKAKAAGADAADAVLFESVSLSHAQRLGKVEKLEREESKDLGLRVFQGQRQAFVSSTDLNSETIDSLVDQAVAMAGSVPEDPYCGLAGSDQIAKEFPVLEIFDPQEPSADSMIAQASACEDAARAVSGITNSEGAESNWGRSGITLVTSNGFQGNYMRSSHSIGVSVLAGEGQGMERDYEFTSTVFGEDLQDPAEVGRSAGERAVRRLGATKPKTGKFPVVFDPRVSSSLLGHMAGAISGPAIARGTSFLKDRLESQIFADGIQIIDDPHRARGMRSKPFDAEGLANRKTQVVENGILKTWIMDLSSAKQLGLQSTGHAARGTSGPPGPSTTNLYMAPGEKSPQELIGEIEEGFYVNELMGMGVNGVTGDYSRGAAGFWIHQGQLAHPISEATIASNLKDIYMAVTQASDLTFKYGTNAPTLRVDGMTVAGA
ncbi:MAG: TldD/PmbA family protein [Pseudomonadota bacterium]